MNVDFFGSVVAGDSADVGCSASFNVDEGFAVLEADDSGAAALVFLTLGSLTTLAGLAGLAGLPGFSADVIAGAARAASRNASRFT
ncbi:unannotated protein [freshwater metagenome]|uniref:Unannotated protein n=1 Tax=freshwater metagenome TaxID=449393 RepID=A0A6J6ECP3_9ZZZZ